MAVSTAPVTIPTWVIQVVIGFFICGALGLMLRSLFRSLKDWISDEIKLLSTPLKQVVTQVTPNGGDTQTNGDITKRIESTLNEHVQQDVDVQSKQTREMKKLRRELRNLHGELHTLTSFRFPTELGEGQSMSDLRSPAETTTRKGTHA